MEMKWKKKISSEIKEHRKALLCFERSWVGSKTGYRCCAAAAEISAAQRYPPNCLSFIWPASRDNGSNVAFVCQAGTSESTRQVLLRRIHLQRNERKALFSLCHVSTCVEHKIAETNNCSLWAHALLLGSAYSRELRVLGRVWLNSCRIAPADSKMRCPNPKTPQKVFYSKQAAEIRNIISSYVQRIDDQELLAPGQLFKWDGKHIFSRGASPYLPPCHRCFAS